METGSKTLVSTFNAAQCHKGTQKANFTSVQKLQEQLLTMANVKKSPPISSFIFFSVPVIPRQGPHHSEYTSTTAICNKYECNVQSSYG
jgi:hypothetical protein